jgi:hypothetical protein
MSNKIASNLFETKITQTCAKSRCAANREKENCLRHERFKKATMLKRTTNKSRRLLKLTCAWLRPGAAQIHEGGDGDR